MLIFLQKHGLEDAYVLGILVEGFSLTTYYMDTKGKTIFRMIEIGNARLIYECNEFGSFRVSVKTIVQSEVAEDFKLISWNKQRAKAKLVTKNLKSSLPGGNSRSRSDLFLPLSLCRIWH
ncbi:unnamed protein product [Absidia cylindrospora]